MAGLKGKSGLPGNMNAFTYGLAAIQKRREEGILTQHEFSGDNRQRRYVIQDNQKTEQPHEPDRSLALCSREKILCEQQYFWQT